MWMINEVDTQSSSLYDVVDAQSIVIQISIEHLPLVRSPIESTSQVS